MKVTIESIGETQSFGANGFTKREWIGVDNDNPDYPQPIKFELIKDNCQKIDSFSIGQEVDVQFNIRGNRWTDPKTNTEKIFNSLQVWKINAADQAIDITPERDQAEATAKDPDWMNDSGQPDDLPFIISLPLLATFLLQSLPF